MTTMTAVHYQDTTRKIPDLPWPHENEYIFRAQFCAQHYRQAAALGLPTRRFRALKEDRGPCDVAGCNHTAVRKEQPPASLYLVI